MNIPSEEERRRAEFVLGLNRQQRRHLDLDDDEGDYPPGRHKASKARRKMTQQSRRRNR